MLTPGQAGQNAEKKQQNEYPHLRTIIKANWHRHIGFCLIQNHFSLFKAGLQLALHYLLFFNNHQFGD